uniref:Putative ovule protein n=1 Tax=Solanum chacoense TaxID=4108 RepID=A0A0V0HGM8_SOLCH
MRETCIDIRFGMFRLSVFSALNFRSGANECLHAHLALDIHSLLVSLELTSLLAFHLFHVLLTSHLCLLSIASTHGLVCSLIFPVQIGGTNLGFFSSGFERNPFYIYTEQK